MGLQVITQVWDSNAAFTTVLDDPQAFGFVDAVSYGNAGDFWGYAFGCLSLNNSLTIA